MNIKVVWDNESKTTIRYIFTRGWTWVEFRDAASEAITMLDTVQHKVNVIMDVRDAGLIPQGAFNNAQKIFGNKRHPNINLTVLVGDSFLHRLTEIVTKLYRPKAQQWDLAVVKTLEEAHKLLEEYSKDMPPAGPAKTEK